MSDNHQISPRHCAVCGTVLDTKNAKAKFCSGKCRSANHFQQKEQNRLLQEVKVTELSEGIQQLSEAPVTRKERVQEVNIAWRRLQQESETQSARCDELKAELVELDKIRRGLTGTNKGAYLGAGLGLSLVILVLAWYYKHQELKRVDLLFAVISIISLIWVVFLLAWGGRQLQGRLIESNDATHLTLANLDEKQRILNDKLKEELSKLEQLRDKMDQLPQYDREVVTTINEIRTLTTA